MKSARLGAILSTAVLAIFVGTAAAETQDAYTYVVPAQFARAVLPQPALLMLVQFVFVVILVGLAVAAIVDSLFSKEDRASRRQDRWYRRRGAGAKSSAAADTLRNVRFRGYPR